MCVALDAVREIGDGSAYDLVTTTNCEGLENVSGLEPDCHRIGIELEVICCEQNASPKASR